MFDCEQYKYKSKIIKMLQVLQSWENKSFCLPEDFSYFCIFFPHWNILDHKVLKADKCNQTNTKCSFQIMIYSENQIFKIKVINTIKVKAIQNNLALSEKIITPLYNIFLCHPWQKQLPSSVILWTNRFTFCIHVFYSSRLLYFLAT